MANPYDQVKEFHEAFGHPISDNVELSVDHDLLKLRLELIFEELGELLAGALNNGKQYSADSVTSDIFGPVHSSLHDLKDATYHMLEVFDGYDPISVADALGDLIYVIVGFALSVGIPIEKVVDEIHESNMTKLGEDGKPIYREDGKIMKGPNYRKPDIAKVMGLDQ